MPRTKTIARATEHDAALARQIGARIREARRRAGLTQQQLAGDRYTKAYVSALETGIARPSMVALSYLSERLGLPPSHFLDEQSPIWTRLEVDMKLASGRWEEAADGYAKLLETTLDEPSRAEVLRGQAEALVRLDRGREAVTAAAEAARIFASLGKVADEALARYWLAYGLYLSDAENDARSMLTGLLERVRAGLKVEPDFEVRLLMALAAVESRLGNYRQSLAHLEAARGMAEDLDDRRRAMFLYNLAISYRETGDVEAAIRAGTRGLALLRSAGSDFESAQIENDLAMAYLATGDVSRARELAEKARREFEQAGDDRYLSAVLDTQAQVALAAGEREQAIELARRASDLARDTGNRAVQLTAMLTEARAVRAAGDATRAEARYAEAAAVAREGGVGSRLRDVLREWADLRAEQGDHRGAYELTSEALAVG
ncbi:MAG TPA: tetratricopeptide repeat protein [candidate division Zixibacteria bacterium]|nr:tetratricopeptide repeat protein [candidate division Zixibacteria bacterium]